MKMCDLRILWAWVREDNQRLVRLVLIVSTLLATVAVVLLIATMAAPG